jgi:hypothetical protein
MERCSDEALKKQACRSALHLAKSDALRHVILTFVDRAVSWWQSSSLWQAVPQQMAV